jgi:hypothetical protein
VLSTTVTADFASAVASASVGVNVTVQGAVPGDFVLVAPAAVTSPAPSGGFSGVVTAANTVRVVYHNDSAGTVDLPSQSVRITVLGW